MTVRPTALRRLGYRLYRALLPGVRIRLVRWLTPNYTVGAVVLVRDPAGRLLLVRHPRTPRWSLPGGLAARGETPRRAAARELAEEVNITAPSELLREAIPNAIIYARTQQVDTVFTLIVEPSGVDLQVDSAELAEAAWHSIDALPPLTGATVRLLSAYGLGPAAGRAAERATKGNASSPVPKT